ncbi:MAG: tRNA (adenosine(37)-N6)-threonylcarbamoyltransferase complex ATPase subunit type 1 TsaE [Magnetococcales bacterium]|nr:tRNA (adenosine(37)-N6)-threonylcarbamoyltransferase complex ATPase subunit type 1 TsaE [Magnetococcales bacterium]
MTALSFRHTSRSEAESEGLARRLSSALTSPLTILLEGDLGSGKSVWARGILRGLGVTDDYITSPTFTLVNSYPEGRLAVHHFDLYRLACADELAWIGMEEYLDGESVLLVEWPDKGGDWIPAQHLHIRLEHVQSQPEWRQIVMTAQGAVAQHVLHRFQWHDTTP